MIEAGDFNGVKEAMEKSMAEGSQTYEEHFAQLIENGTITREEGLAFADSPTNLLWRLQNTQEPMSRAAARSRKTRRPTQATFTEITLDLT